MRFKRIVKVDEIIDQVNKQQKNSSSFKFIMFVSDQAELYYVRSKTRALAGIDFEIDYINLAVHAKTDIGLKFMGFLNENIGKVRHGNPQNNQS